jgi:hypothetical protein
MLIFISKLNSIQKLSKFSCFHYLNKKWPQHFVGAILTIKVYLAAA